MWHGFWRLHISRPYGFDAPLRIPPTEIEAYARLQLLAPHQANELLFYVDMLDAKWMEHYRADRQEQERIRSKQNKQNVTPQAPQAGKGHGRRAASAYDQFQGRSG